MSYLPNWPNEKPSWSEEYISIISTSLSTSSNSNVTLEEILTKSEEFPIKFPIDVVRCKVLKNTVPAEILEKNINSAYPLLHENALLLYIDFLTHKRQYGNSIEKEFYKNMSILDFINRLLVKRAAMFMGRYDSYILMDGTKGSGKWDLIGKPNQNKSKLTIDDCLTYDEIKLSVFLSVSSYSYFINDGSRRNHGEVVKNRENIQNDGIVIGLIGARFKKVNFMEYQEMVISKTQNTRANGYGNAEIKTLPQVFLNFYEESPVSYDTVEEKIKTNSQRFVPVGNNAYFDNVVFSKRIALSIDTLLIEANHRAKERKNTAYIHVVGLGLGVWKCSPHQESIFVQAFANRLKFLGKNLTCVSDVDFSYFNQTEIVGDCKNGEVFKIDDHPLSGIKIHLSKRNPHVKLTGSVEGKLLVVSYAWDGNSLPGNEFWNEKLGSSGDSAAAASTQISEIHNSHINSKVSANNLHIATPNGVVTFVEYVSSIKNKKMKLDAL